MLVAHRATREGRKGTKARGISHFGVAPVASVERVDHLAGHALDLQARVVVER